MKINELIKSMKLGTIIILNEEQVIQLINNLTSEKSKKKRI